MTSVSNHDPDPCTVTYNPKIGENLLGNLNGLRISQTLTDFTIKVGNKEIQCHRLILTAGCPYFAALFSTGMMALTKGETCLDPLDAEVVENIIPYIYGCKVSIKWSKIREAVQAADFLQLSELKSGFCAYILEHLSPDNSISMYTYARKNSLLDIEKSAKDIMHTAIKQISKGADFMKLSRAELMDYITDDKIKLKTTDAAILEACLEWIQHDHKERESALLDIFGHIMVNTLPCEYLLDIGIKYKDIISSSEEVQVIMYRALVGSGKQRPSPSVKCPPKPFQMRLAVMGGVRKDPRKYLDGLAELVKPNSALWCCSIYDDAIPSGNWNVFTKIPKAMQSLYGTLVAVPGGIMKLGGQVDSYTDQCSFFSTDTSEWTSLPVMPEAMDEMGTAVIGNNLYVFGGRSTNGALSSVFHLDLDTKIWHSEPSMVMEEASPIVIAMGKRIYVIFGTISSSISLQMYDPSTKTWVLKCPMPENGKETCVASDIKGKYGASAVATDQFFYVVGGWKKICTRYDTETDTWSALTGPKMDHRGGSAVLINGTIYLCGGGSYTTDIEEYDIQTDTWKMSHISMPMRLREFTVTLLPLA